jgi:hypothetical protein
MKPIVKYKSETATTMLLIRWDKMGNPFWCGRLDVIDHPKLGTTNLRTSKIVGFDPAKGIIETVNTVYVPEEIK